MGLGAVSQSGVEVAVLPLAKQAELARLRQDMQTLARAEQKITEASAALKGEGAARVELTQMELKLLAEASAFERNRAEAEMSRGGGDEVVKSSTGGVQLAESSEAWKNTVGAVQIEQSTGQPAGIEAYDRAKDQSGEVKLTQWPVMLPEGSSTTLDLIAVPTADGGTAYYKRETNKMVVEEASRRVQREVDAGTASTILNAKEHAYFRHLSQADLTKEDLSKAVNVQKYRK